LNGLAIATVRASAALAFVALSFGPARAGDLAKALLIDNSLAAPVYVTSPPGEERLLFVVEQAGLVQVFEDEVKQATPFLDIHNRVALDGQEQGLFSIAFAPDYATSRHFYIAYTNNKGDVEVDEFKRTKANPKLADPATRREVIRIPHRDGKNHNGGQLQFGKDGYLYISVGDGGSLSGPKGAAARDLKQLLGKILRIDPRPTESTTYRIPRDNPYVGTGNRAEIYAYGLRNPWRFSFDGNYMAIADEGEDREDEVNIWTTNRTKGVNFGWPQFEGKLSMPGGLPGPNPATMPLYVHEHTDGRCAIIGGYVAHDPEIPVLEGRYLFGDLCGGVLMSMIPDVHEQKARSLKAVGPVATALTSFGIGPHQRIYFTQQTGQLSRLAAP
jgi:glucose/arabinose dehydrogenase